MRTVASLVMALFFVPRAGAQTTDTLRISDAVSEARRANPMLQAARYQADAAGERGSQAGALPDPVLSLGLRNRPLDDFGTDDPMTMNWIGLSQSFPWPGNQGFGQQQQEHFKTAADLDADDMERRSWPGSRRSTSSSPSWTERSA